jgi:hypothetical protein
MLQNPSKIHSLITEYKRLCDLAELTPQGRGQRFNFFIAELLQCWAIDATPNRRGSGEIDVVFEFNGRHFNLEAKWEKEPVNVDPIAKLEKRLRQRLAGTIGLLLSMSSFTSEAVKDLKEGGQLSVLLLTREHFEAMLSGFIPPDEMIRQLVKKASEEGDGFVPVQKLFDRVPANQLEISFDAPAELADESLVIESIPEFRAKVIASNLPFGSSGIAELSKTALLITLKDGIYFMDYEKRRIDLSLGVPYCSRNVLVGKDGVVYIARQAGVACLRNGELSFVGGGFWGSACFFHGENESVCIFSNGFTGGKLLNPEIAQLGESLGDEKRTILNYSPGCGMNAAPIEEARFLITGRWGCAIVESGKPTLLFNRSIYAMGLARIAEDKLLLSSGGVDLTELETLNLSVRQIAKLRLQDSVSELAVSTNGGVFLFAHYSTATQGTAGILIHCEY